MRAATHPRREQQLIAIDTCAPTMHLASASALPEFLQTGDLVIVNDAATLPASLMAQTTRGEKLELRLAQRIGPSQWLTLVMGEGSWREDTDDRSPPPSLELEDVVHIGASLRARVVARRAESARLLVLQFDTDESALRAAIYREGRAIQYSYHKRDLPLRWLQTPFAGRPWSVEMPSAGRILSWNTLIRLRKVGVQLAALTHSAGLSATGDAAIDALLPLPERYEIPGETVDAIHVAKARGGRVIAVGTTVVRALEGCMAQHDRLRAGPGETNLVLSPSHQLRIVEGVISGLHASGESHYQLLSAFASAAKLDAAYQAAHDHDFQNHELGDAMLLLPRLQAQNLSNSTIRNAPYPLLSRSGIGTAGSQVSRPTARRHERARSRLSKSLPPGTRRHACG